MVACLASWCRGTHFHHQVMSDNIDDIQDPRYHMSRRTFFNLYVGCMGLDGSTCSECLPVDTCDFEPPEHLPRTSVRAHTCAVVFGRAPHLPRSREHEKRPAAGREKNVGVQKNTFIHAVVIYLLSRWLRRLRDLVVFLCCCSHINSSLQCCPWSQDRVQ